MKSVFVSFVYEHKPWKDKLVAWAEAGRLGDVTITGESEDVRPQGEQAVKNHLSPKLKGCAAILVLVGDDTHDRPWVDYEVQHAKSHHKRLACVRIPKTRGAPPAAVRDEPPVTFEPGAIRHALGT